MPNHGRHSQENRKSTRYMVGDSSAVMLMPLNIISHSVLNISKSGMAFYYNGQASKDEIFKNTLATFFADTVGITNFPIQVVCDTELNEEFLHHQSENCRPQKLYLRRCAIKFSRLSQEQDELLNNYIQYLSKNALSEDDSVL